MEAMSRRAFLGIVPLAAVAPSISAAGQDAPPTGSFPRQNEAIVKEMVTVAHGNVARVKELLAGRPALARATWDWGYGDWESALGAAAHVGNTEIARILLGNGAHPTIFSAAMLGELDVVRAFITASPGIQKTRGPHGLTLLSHARAGKNDAMVRYLESVGGADERYPNQPLADDEAAGLGGTYAFGTGPSECFVVARNTRGDVTIRREGESDRGLFHHGDRQFNPAGAEAVRIRFEPRAGTATALIVEDGSVVVRAARL